MKRCPYCGRELDNDALFCPACQTDLTKNDHNETKTPFYKVRSTEQPVSEKLVLQNERLDRTGTVLKIIGIVITVVFSISALVIGDRIEDFSGPIIVCGISIAHFLGGVLYGIGQICNNTRSQ